MNEIIAFLNEKGIAFFDTATAVNRLKDNASDAFLEIVEHTDIRALLSHMSQCHAIATTGEKATTEVCNYFNVDTIPSPNTKVALKDGLTLYRLPSSSRAYPLSFDKKVEAYRKMFEAVFGA
jgi:G:T/U-mismatch repair DNA glycosylase